MLLAAAAVAAGAVPRLLVSAGAAPDWLRPFAWSDVLHTWERGLSGGRLPYFDSFFEYPPLVGYLAGALSLVTDSALSYVLAWTVLQAAAAAAIAWLLAREIGPGRTLARWSLAPQLLLLGSLNFDLLAVLALVAAIVLARRGRALSAAAALGLGTAAKLFPAVALPLFAIRAGPRWAAVAVVFGGVVALAYAPSSTAAFTPLAGIGRYGASIGANPDSAWGLVAALLAGVGLPGQALVLIPTLAGLALTYLIFVVPRARHPDPAVPAALAVIALLLWSRLYSPQFSLWVLPFLALLAIRGRTYALLAAADVAVFFSIFPLTLVRWPEGDPVAAVLLTVMAAAVVLRHLALWLAWRDLSSARVAAGSADMPTPPPAASTAPRQRRS